jgi:hypothetical protein
VGLSARKPCCLEIIRQRATNSAAHGRLRVFRRVKADASLDVEMRLLVETFLTASP